MIATFLLHGREYNKARAVRGESRGGAACRSGMAFHLRKLIPCHHTLIGGYPARGAMTKIQEKENSS